MRYLWALLIFAFGEIVGLLVFVIIRKKLGPSGNDPGGRWAAARGTLERLVLVTGLVSGYPHILTLFGALKIGTRLQDESKSHISNNYFLIGNLTSVLLAMLCSVAIGALWR